MKLSVILEAVDNITKPMRQIAARVRALSSQLGLDRIAGSVGNVGKSFANVAKETGEMAKRLAASVGLVGGAIFGLVKSAADAGDAANDTAARIGIGVEAFQRLAYAAQMNGADQETAAKGLSVLNKQVTEAAKGNKAAAANFKALGISVRDANGKLKPTEQIFAEIADRFKEMPDGAKEAYLSMKLFGDEAGPRLVQTLNNGSDGLKRYGDEAQRLGKVIGQDAANASGDFNDALDRMLGSLAGLRNVIAAKLMPVLTPLINLVTEWVVANRELIATRVQDFIAALPARIAAVRQNVLDLYQRLSPLIGAFRSLIEWIGPLNAAMLAAGGIIGGKFVISVGQLVMSLAGLGRALLATGLALSRMFLILAANPIGLVITAIAGLAAGVYLIYKNWDKIGPWFQALWDGVKATFSSFGDWIKDGFVGAITGSFQTIWSVVGPIIDGLRDGIGWASSIASKVGSSLGFGDGEGGAGGSGPVGAAKVPVGATSRVQTGGRLDISINSQTGRAEVTRMAPANPNEVWHADTGMVMAGY
ncbi:MAG: phage tail tape measure protein [Rhodospirillaceae bacterium]|nr:MAG: phage tail tape measure protein [Rhodospirillaceae bacterium]